MASMARTAPWTPDDLPDLSGRTVVVSGANSGIGREAASMLAAAGADVVLACRDPGRASAALESIRAELPRASVEAAALDLASLASVRAFAEGFARSHGQLDVLLNNAGVMAVPRRTTSDGFELQLGTNHLGHFALTGLLLPRLLAAPAPRVVNVSSTAHRAGRMRFDDLQGEASYGPWQAYGQSKLANLLFTFELQRRFDAAGTAARSVAAHPGYAATNLQFEGPRMSGSRASALLMSAMNRLFAQDARGGALPLVYAAAAPDVRGGDYFGPGGFAELWGPPKRVAASARARDPEAAARLWQASEALTGVRFDALRA
jgi:NAD(P)-dependent dehydrogenase (short-subunit alcohol dehydrogenase family)